MVINAAKFPVLLPNNEARLHCKHAESGAWNKVACFSPSAVHQLCHGVGPRQQLAQNPQPTTHPREDPKTRRLAPDSSILRIRFRLSNSSFFAIAYCINSNIVM